MTPLPQILVVAFVAWMAWTTIRTFPAPATHARWVAVTSGHGHRRAHRALAGGDAAGGVAVKLVDLDPRFIGAGGEGISQADGSPAPLREGLGIIFDCPCGCGHKQYVPFANPLDGGPPLDSDRRHVWQRVGDTFETLTLSPSILRVGGCNWHGFIERGEARAA